LIKHAVRDMLRQRVYGLALGWEDLNDHGSLREDVAMQTAIGVEREVPAPHTVPSGELGRQANRLAIAPGAGGTIHRQFQNGPD
jgi:hypothetical protein